MRWDLLSSRERGLPPRSLDLPLDPWNDDAVTPSSSGMRRVQTSTTTVHPLTSLRSSAEGNSLICGFDSQGDEGTGAALHRRPFAANERPSLHKSIMRADFGVFETNASNKLEASPTSVPSLLWFRKRHDGCRSLASCQH